jgi:hypothetical protein
MIINFLQTRKPPVLPSLQSPHLKLNRGTAFADDIDALRGFGKDNTDSLGELLFQFFRYYGHEIDYDMAVLSVRNGNLLSKIDKGWHQTTNNRLCVEEPFNTNRNLGNTADDTSFRGLHMELRRAFELIAEAKLEECCEEYVFPKEEQRIWEKPVPQPRPILSRSTSQSRGGRGGNYRGGRHNNHARNGNNSRRASSASSGPMDNGTNYVPQVLPPSITPHEAWLRNQAAQEQLHNDLYTTFSVLRQQEDNLRYQLYAQSQAYQQGHAQAFQQSQRLQPSGSNITSQQAMDRQRGNSFDNPPLTAPLRPDMYFYPLQLQPGHMYGHQSPGTYPSSPSMSPALPEPRRSLHRSNVTGGQGAAGASGGSLRSHSQPAARSVPSPLNLPGAAPPSSGLSGFSSHRQAGGVLIPNFIADENLDPRLESEPAFAESPPDGAPKEYVGYYVSNPPKPRWRREPVIIPAIPAFGDIQRRRRLSTDQFPQVVLDRIRRTSRSPSPHRGQSVSANVAPFKGTQPATTGSNLRPLGNRVPAPLVVNGSSSTVLSPPGPQAAVSEPTVLASPAVVSSKPVVGLAAQSPRLTRVASLEPDHIGYPSAQDVLIQNRPLTAPVVNGSVSRMHDSSQTSPAGLVNKATVDSIPSILYLPEELGEIRVSLSKGDGTGRKSQNGAMSPLDNGSGQIEAAREEIPHLSPVYEARTPSPTANRKFEATLDDVRHDPKSGVQSVDHESRPTLRFALANSTKISPKQNQGLKPNGHTRASKSEGGGVGSWQKIPKKKKGQTFDHNVTSGENQNQGEQLPRNDSERKGG